MSAPQATEFLSGGQRAISCISRLYPLVSRYISLYPLYLVISCYIRTGYREISCPEEGWPGARGRSARRRKKSNSNSKKIASVGFLSKITYSIDLSDLTIHYTCSLDLAGGVYSTRSKSLSSTFPPLPSLYTLFTASSSLSAESTPDVPIRGSSRACRCGCPTCGCPAWWGAPARPRAHRPLRPCRRRHARRPFRRCGAP